MQNDRSIVVRIAVGIDTDGHWCAVGDGNSSDEAKVEFLRLHAPVTVREVYFVEAEVPVPADVILGAVVPRDEPVTDDAVEEAV